ncbi:MAG: hypothetical protein ACREBZ_07875 [Thermoplasmata archaeon]
MMPDGPPGEFGHRFPPIDPRKAVLPRALAGLSQLLLTLVFIFGVSAALWTTSWPSNLSGLLGPNASSYGYLSVHVVLAIILVIVEIVLIAFVARLGRGPILGMSIATFLLTVVAAIAGSLTLMQPAQPLYVLLMALAFLAAWTTNLFLTVRLRWMQRAARWRSTHPTPPAAP